MVKKLLNNIFGYKEKEKYNFILPNVSNNIPETEFDKEDTTTVSSNLHANIEYLRSKYNMLINSDVKIKEFNIPIKAKKVPAFLLYIDGMVSDDNINDFVLEPIFLRNSIKMNETNQNPTRNKICKIQFRKFFIFKSYSSKQYKKRI